MTKVKLLPVLLLFSTASYTASQQFRYPLCQCVWKLLNHEKDVKSDSYDPETFDNCTRALLFNKSYEIPNKEWLQNKCIRQEAILILTKSSHQYTQNFSSYDDSTHSYLLQLARTVNANIRYLLRNVTVSCVAIVMKQATLYFLMGARSFPMAVAVDVTQLTMEMMGFESQAKTVGAVGTTLSAALAGFCLANVAGGAVGAEIGYFTWMATEQMKENALREIGKYLKE